MTHLWVVTTCDEKKILKGSLQDLKKEVQSKQADNKHLFDGLQWRVFIASRVQDITSTKDAAAMAEILYRLVLHGEAWRDEPGTQRHFSVSITGGRKTMSADLQRAATFFEVDTVLQMVYAGEDRDQPYDLSDIRRQRKLHHPVITASEKTPWRPLLEKPWSDEYPGRPLIAQNFPLHDWDRTDLLEVRTWPAEEPDSKALTLGLNKIAGNTKKFADQALACGVGPYFLRHDLRKLIDYLYEALPGRPELKALNDYLDGLGEVIDEESPDWSEKRVCVENLLDLCNRGLILAVGQPVQPQSANQAAWDDLRVIRFDRDAESALPPDPTPLAPWRTWLDGNYRPCRTAKQFRTELKSAPGAVIVLLHRTDLDSQLQAGELDAWLDADPAGDTGRPQRLIFVYAGGWGHRDYTQVVAPRLAARAGRGDRRRADARRVRPVAGLIPQPKRGPIP